MKTGTIITRINCHLMGMCECCSSYRLLPWIDIELGHICQECVGFVYRADEELYARSGDLRRPTKGGNEWEK